VGVPGSRDVQEIAPYHQGHLRDLALGGRPGLREDGSAAVVVGAPQPHLRTVAVSMREEDGGLTFILMKREMCSVHEVRSTQDRVKTKVEASPVRKCRRSSSTTCVRGSDRRNRGSPPAPNHSLFEERGLGLGPSEPKANHSQAVARSNVFGGDAPVYFEQSPPNV
jgi:hypothetical protein